MTRGQTAVTRRRNKRRKEIADWLLTGTPRSLAVSRLRLFDTRTELLDAVLNGEPKYHTWERGDREWREALGAAHIVVGTVKSRDRDVLMEALFWDPDTFDLCWSEGHERCCNEGSEHADVAWYEATNIVLFGYKRPAWIKATTYRRLRAMVVRREKKGDDQGDIVFDIEHDDDLFEEIQTEGVERHIAECLRGSVGAPFHSIP